MSIVQYSKIGERSNGRWNGPRELVRVQIAVVIMPASVLVDENPVVACIRCIGTTACSDRRLVRDPMVDGMVPES